MKQKVFKIFILVIAAGFIFSCRAAMHNWKTGDHGGDSETLINRERISKIIPGVTPSEEIKKIFEAEPVIQKTFLKRKLKKTYREKEYEIDRLWGYRWVPNTVEYRHGMTVYGWTERITLVLFFSNNTVQFYYIKHDVLDEEDNVVRGELDNREITEGTWPGHYCDIVFYEYYMLGEKISDFKRKECSIMD